MKPPLQIPTKTRELVTTRERGLCGRCGARGVEMSHRRPRGIKDEHTHCPCNLIWACSDCARGFAHMEPAAARREGFTLSRYIQLPPAEHAVLFRPRWVMLDCVGGVRRATDEETARFEEWVS